MNGPNTAVNFQLKLTQYAFMAFPWQYFILSGRSLDLFSAKDMFHCTGSDECYNDCEMLNSYMKRQEIAERQRTENTHKIQSDV